MTSRGAPIGRSTSARLTAGSVAATVATHRTGTTSRPGPLKFTCNKCRVEGIANSAYYTKCNCIFCVGCAQSHFQNNSDCPGCGNTRLTENDIFNLAVSGPMRNKKSLKEILESLLVRNHSPNTSLLSYDGLCRQVVANYDEGRTAMCFVLQQLTKEAKYQKNRGSQYENRSQRMEQRIRLLEAENIQLQERFDEQLGAANVSIQELQGQLVEKESMIRDFRRQYEQRTISARNCQDGYGNTLAPSQSRGLLQPTPPTRQYGDPHADDFCSVAEQPSPMIINPGMLKRGSSKGYRMIGSHDQRNLPSHSLHINKRRRTLSSSHGSSPATDASFEGHRRGQPWSR